MLHRVHRTDMRILWLLFCIYASHTIQPCITKTSPCGHHMEAYGSIMQCTYCHPFKITKKIHVQQPSTPPKKNTSNKKQNQLQTNSQHLLFLFRSWFPFDEAPMTFLRSSGLMDPEPSASKRLKADRTASFHKGRRRGGGWVGLGRLGWVGED